MWIARNICILNTSSAKKKSVGVVLFCFQVECRGGSGTKRKRGRRGNWCEHTHTSNSNTQPVEKRKIPKIRVFFFSTYVHIHKSSKRIQEISQRWLHLIILSKRPSNLFPFL